MKKYFIIKADDFLKDGISKNWKYFLDMTYDNSIPVMLGIVGRGVLKFKSQFRYRHIEKNGFFAHGYKHFVNKSGKCEYRGTSFKYQIESIKKTIEVAKKELGVQIYSFGAPGNATDFNTSKALVDLIEEIKYVFFAPTETSKIFIRRNFEFEYKYELKDKYLYYLNLIFSKYFHYGFQNCDYYTLISRYSDIQKRPFNNIVCGQIHPNWWSISQLRQLGKFINHIKIEYNIEFINVDKVDYLSLKG